MRKLLPTLILSFLLALAVSPARALEPQFVDAQMTYTSGESIQFSARLDPAQPATAALIFISTPDRARVFTDEARYDPATGGSSYTYTGQPGAGVQQPKRRQSLLK